MCPTCVKKRSAKLSFIILCTVQATSIAWPKLWYGLLSRYSDRNTWQNRIMVSTSTLSLQKLLHPGYSRTRNTAKATLRG